VFPQIRPWDEHKEEADLEAEENKGDCEEAVHGTGGISHKRHIAFVPFVASFFATPLWL
jgi:hypothetical protein